jgi:hypothetical protein
VGKNIDIVPKYYEVDKPSLYLFGSIRTEQINAVSALRRLDSNVSKATYGNRIFDKHMCGFVERNTAYADFCVEIDKTSALIQESEAYANPDHEPGSVPETIIVNDTILAGKTKAIWPFYLSNTRMLGSIELTGIIVCGLGIGITMTGTGMIKGGETYKGRDIRVGPEIKLGSDVSFDGELWIVGSGTISCFTEEALAKLIRAVKPSIIKA